MKRYFSGMLIALSFAAMAAQTAGKPFPAGVLTAKTIAIVDDARNPAVSKGAVNALQSWGQFKVVDDPQLADITLRFEKERNHDGHDTQKTNPDGKTDYGYSMSFGASVHMEAFYKDADAPFYKTKTEDSKAKAGASCVDSFHSAFRTAEQGAQP